MDSFGNRSVWLGLCLTVASMAGSAQTFVPPLENGGFEDTNVLSRWRTWIYHEGQPPSIRADNAEAKTGRQSLRIEAAGPADVAVGQVVALPPNSIWKARCWVKTRELTARDQTDTGGALHIQTSDGAPLARGSSAFGTSPWHETEAVFRVPADGRAKVALFYVGFGKGTGVAWFDDVRLEALQVSGPETVKVTADRLTRRPIDAKQGGQFIEPLCNLIPSMLAQQVANTSFEADPPWNVAFRREVDRPNRPWYPDGAVHVTRYSYDTNRPFNGRRSLRMENHAQHARAGIAQDGYSVREGSNYRLRLHLRGDRPTSLRASLHGPGGLLAGTVQLGPASPDWRPAEGILRATRSCDSATLSLDFEGPGSLWLDRVSLIGEDAVLGLWRRDVVQALRELRPAVIRFGGSALETYEWDQCLGSWDQRVPFVQTYWGGIEENFVGVEEFVQLCRHVEAEPLVCVRWTGKKPEDAAAEVSYFNAAQDTVWGGRRAANGHRRPYGVKYWQIGNEVGGATYDASVRAFAEAMRGADPSVKVLSSFPSSDILRASGGYLDYLCPHHYGCADLAGMDRDFGGLEEQIRRYGGGKDARIAVTEWNTTAGDWELGRASLQTLGNALSVARYHNLMHRHADSVEIAIRSNLIDSFGSGVILTGPGWIYFSPAYHAQRLYARAAGSYPLRLRRHADLSGANLPWTLDEPDLSAALSPDGRFLRIYGVNSTERPIEVRMVLDGLGEGALGGSAHVLMDSEKRLTPEALNLRDEPERVRLFSSPCGARGRDFAVTFEPFSVALFELELKQEAK